MISVSHPNDFEEIVRTVQALLFIAAFYGLSQRLGRKWKTLPRAVRRISIWFYGLLFAGAWGTLEQIDQNVPLGTRNFIILFVVSGLLMSIALRFDGDDSPDPVYVLDKKGKYPWTWRIRKVR